MSDPSQLAGVADWASFDPSVTTLESRENQNLWLKMVIPPTEKFSGPVIQFPQVRLRFSFFLDNKKIYSFGEGLRYPGMPFHLVPVPVSSHPSVGYMRIESNLALIGPRGGVFLGSRSFFVGQLLNGDLASGFLISVFALIGLAGFVLFFFYRSVKTYANLGAFAIACGLYFVSRMPSKIIFEIDPAWTSHLGLLGLYASPIFFNNFYREIFSIHHVRFFRVTDWLNILFFVSASVCSFFTAAGPLDLMLPFFVIAPVVFLSAFFYALRFLRSHPYVRTFYAGAVSLLFSVIWEIVAYIGHDYENFSVLIFGVLIFVGSLIVMQGQFFGALFQRARENGRLVEDSRQRLERVLECTRDLARTHDYKGLIRVVAEALIAELNVKEQDVTVDFFMPASHSGALPDAIHQISYMYSFSMGSATLFEVNQNASSSIDSLQAENQKNKLTSLPGLSDASSKGYLFDSASPVSVLTIPLHQAGFAGAVTIRKYSAGVFEFSDFSHLSKFVNSISSSLMIALQNLEYVDEVKANVVIESQLDAAMSLQAALLPEPLKLAGIDYSAYCKSAGKTGGDWHGYFHCVKTNRLFLTVGDVTGHDFAASIMTGLAAGAVRAWEAYDSERFDDGARAVENLASLVNRVFCTSNRDLKYMSMFFACIDLDSGKLHSVNAGHPHPFLFSPACPPSTIHISGNLLGYSSESVFYSETVQLNPGDSIFIYTDGLFENQGSLGVRLSRRTLLRNLSQKQSAQDMLNGVLECAQNVWGNILPDDDVTLVAVTWRNPQRGLFEDSNDTAKAV